MREYLTNLLLSSGCQVVAVNDGLQALEAVRGELPDLVISDVMMPGLDGIELLAELRKNPRTAALPILLLSARAGQEASIEGLHAGADDYLVKPFAAAELLARVRANIELARLRNHHARWRTALVDSLQEAFFVCDEHGAVIEINTAFADMLGYGPEGLPYAAVHPWWPDVDTDPEAHRAGGDGVHGPARRDSRDLHRPGDGTATGTGCGSPSTSTMRRIPTPRAGSWSGRSATSPPSTTPCSARRRWLLSTSNWRRLIHSTTRCEEPSRSCVRCGGRDAS